MSVVAGLQNTAGIFATTIQYLHKSQHADIEISKLKAGWANDILTKLQIQTEVRGQPSESPSILYVGNHISYLDIPLLMQALPQVSFIAKNELSAWPVFGRAAKKIDTIFVKRSSGHSRNAAKQAIIQGLKSGKRIAIFPSGTTCLYENKPWRHGAFDIAKTVDCHIQPFRLMYTPVRRAAYIDRDFFPLHLYQLGRGPNIKAILEFHAPVFVHDVVQDALYWQNWSRGLSANI